MIGSFMVPLVACMPPSSFGYRCGAPTPDLGLVAEVYEICPCDILQSTMNTVKAIEDKNYEIRSYVDDIFDTVLNFYLQEKVVSQI